MLHSGNRVMQVMEWTRYGCGLALWTRDLKDLPALRNLLVTKFPFNKHLSFSFSIVSPGEGSWLGYRIHARCAEFGNNLRRQQDTMIQKDRPRNQAP